MAQDTSGYIIFLFVLGAACASVVAIGFVVGTIKGLEFVPKAWHLTLTTVALMSSWLAIQTVFGFHYARAYYRDERQQPARSGGLAFPGGADPDYMDFAYYSFVVGMTSQVSDVQVISPIMRRLTLVHGVLAFVFNIAVLALSINTIAEPDLTRLATPPTNATIAVRDPRSNRRRRRRPCRGTRSSRAPPARRCSRSARTLAARAP